MYTLERSWKSSKFTYPVLSLSDGCVRLDPSERRCRPTSRFRPLKYTGLDYRLPKWYVDFVTILRDRSRFIFEYEHPKKEIDIFGLARRSPFNGKVEHHRCHANGKNRRNILAVRCLKKWLGWQVECITIDECSNTPVLTNFCVYLIKCGVLLRGGYIQYGQSLCPHEGG